MGKPAQGWSGFAAALSKSLEKAGGEMHWKKLQTELVAAYNASSGSDAGDDEMVGNAALASIPESYLSKDDAMVRAPKRAAAADSDDDDDDESEEAPKPKKAKTESPAAGGEGSGAANTKVFIKGLPYSVDEATLRKDFSECGEITALQFPFNDEGKPKGFAFITFATRAGFDAARKFDNTDYGGRSINVIEANDKGKGGGKGKGKADDWTCPACGDLVFGRNAACRKCGAARPGGAPGGGGAEGGKGGIDNENTVFVRGLPFSATEDSVKKDFAECGELVSMKLPLNEEGKPKGIAFIKYASKEGFEAALKFDNTDYGGRTIYVSKAGEKGDKGKDGKGKGKDGKDKGKGKGKGKKGKAPSEAKAKSTGCIIEGAGDKKTFDDSDDE